MIERILIEVYGVGLGYAEPATILWAAESIPNVEEAKAELRRVNDKRERMGRLGAYPPFGSKLF